MTFQDLPIKRKVIAVTMLTSVTALVLTAVAFMVYDQISFRQAIIRHLSITASIVAAQSSAALSFKNPKDAQENLAVLRGDSHVRAAALYDNAGDVLVRYPTDALITTFPLVPDKPGRYIRNGKLIFFQPVVEGDAVCGTLYLEYDLGALHERLRLYAGIALLVLFSSLLIALAISNVLQRHITESILALADTAKLVSNRGDYSVRARKIGSDEIGLLADGFNQMLSRIQEQTLALSESGEQLRLALEASRTGTWDWHLKTNKVTWDQYNQRLFGLQPGAFKGTYDHFLDLIHPEDRAGVGYAVTQALERKAELNSEFRVVWPDGSVHYLVTRGKALYDDSGQPVRMNGVTADITERKMAEEVRAFLAAIVESSDDAVIGKDLQSIVVSWNAGAQRMFGYTAAEMLGRPITPLLSPDRPEEEARILEDVKRGGIRHFETVRLHKDGHAIEVSLTVSPIKDAHDKIIGFSSIVRDITDRKRADAALEQQAAILREQAQLLDLANVLARDLDNRIILWNSGMEKMYGWTRSEALGKTSHELLHAEFGQPLELIRATLFSQGHWEGELIHTRKDGQRRFVASQWVLHNDAHGQPAAILEISNDITERKRAEEQILRMNAELEQRVEDRTAELTTANKELEAFTYSVAHDLRAPLRHIDAFTRILNEEFATVLPDEAKVYLDNILNGSRNMSRLVDDLLNLARVGRQELKCQPTPLGAVVQDVLVDLKRETEGRSIEWRIQPLPTLECDSGLIRQVFTNLLSNAVKYTRPRSAAVIEVGHTKMNDEMAVFVRDNGVGFSMKYAGKLFGVFQRLHRAEQFEGTGVGLATVDRIVRKHGGSVWAEAAVDEGATFYFTVGCADKGA